MFKAIIFDFDMTLVDSYDVGNKAFHNLKTKHKMNIDLISEQEVWGSNPYQWAKKLATLDKKLDVNEILRLNRGYMNQYYLDCKIKEIDMLQEFKQRGLKLAVVSNNADDLIKKVIHNNYNKQIKFDIVIGFEDKYKTRTKAEKIHECLDYFKISAKEAMMVGDHPNDITSGKEAGVITVAIPSGLHSAAELKEYEPDILLKNLKDLKQVINK